MDDELLLIGSIFGLSSSAVLLIGLVWAGRSRRVDDRLVELVDESPRRPTPRSTDTALSRMGTAIMPDNEARRLKMQQQLQQAGLYRRGTLAIFLGMKVVLMVIPMLLGVGLSVLNLVPLGIGIMAGALIGLLGMIIPTFWLNALKSRRQMNIRRALPDATDVIVICLEGGLSLSAALARVAAELRTAHPLLASEMNIVQREVQLGASTGDALRQFANRFDLEELRSLASVVSQADRFGTSLVKALRVHADTLRLRRHQYAESMAQKAPVKLIFPTVLCIFPALYIVLMGPALVQVFQMLSSLSR